MSGAGADFLSLVAARAIGEMPLVEPRLPSRFEAETGPSRLRAESDDRIEEAVETQSGWSAPALRRAAIGPQAGLLPLVPDVEEAPPAPPVARRPRRPLEPDGDPRPTAVEPDARSSPDRSPQNAAHAEPAMLPIAPPPILAAPMPPRQPMAAEEPESRLAPPKRAAPAAAPPAVAQPAAATPAVAPAPSRTPTRSEPAPQPAPPVLRPVATPQIARQPRRGERRQPEPLPPPETVVNIVISRIDVRAQVPPPQAAPAKARVAAPAPQTLSEYLQRREAAR